MSPMPPSKPHWAHLIREVVESGLCTGCAACVVACPYDVLGYDAERYKPFHLNADGGPLDCTYGERGCTLCTRACARFRDWEPEIDNLLFGRARAEEEVEGVVRHVALARATDPGLRAGGQDGGFVSAALIWALEHDMIEAALVSYTNGDDPWRPVPGLARNREEVIASAGSRYTYSANTLAYDEAVSEGLERLAMVGMGCMASAPPAMRARKAGKIARRFVLGIGLLCSKTFEDSIFPELLQARYGLASSEIAKINIKGRLQVWDHSSTYHEIPLKEAHAWTREGCKACPDFAAEHADISAGGIGAFGDQTLVLVRTERGAELFDAMVEGGAIETRPIEDDPGALGLLRKLSRSSRRRWPASAPEAPRRMPSSTEAGAASR